MSAYDPKRTSLLIVWRDAARGCVGLGRAASRVEAADSNPAGIARCAKPTRRSASQSMNRSSALGSVKRGTTRPENWRLERENGVKSGKLTPKGGMPMASAVSIQLRLLGSFEAQRF